MAHREVGLGRLKSLADTAGRKMTETTKAAAERAAEVAGDAQEAARRTADHAKSGAAGVTDAVSSLVRPKKKETVDLSQLPDSAKLLYCRVLLDLALTDGQLDPREISNLYLFASTIGLGTEARGQLRRTITDGTRTQDGDSDSEQHAVAEASQLLDLVAEDERCALTTLLVRDLIRISRADNEAAETERAQIVRIASLAFPDSAEKGLIAVEGVGG